MHTQIVLTRIFSVVVWYHFAFFAISVALLGLSASALLVHGLQRKLSGDHTPKVLAASTLVFAASILGLAVVILRATPDWFGVGEASFFTMFTPKLLGIFCVTTTPFVAGGFVLSLALSRWPEAIHRNYAYDLSGAALACGLVIPVLDRFGGPKALLVSTAFAALAAPVFALAQHSDVDRTGAQSRVRLARLALPWSAAGLGIVMTGLALSAAGALEIRVAKGLDLARMAPEYNRWNSFSLVSVFPSWSFRGWGLSPKYTASVPPEKALVIDMNAFTPVLAFNGDFAAVKHTQFDLSALAFRLHPGLQHVCVVGAGGGKDVLAALAAGAKRVTAIEVNPLIANDVMRDRYRAFTGGLYDRHDVDVHVEDGRSFLRRSTDRYDVIVISMVDTSAATAAGAYALAENSLYTVDAFKDFLARLAPGGILTVASVSLDGLAVGARLASLARAALQKRGAELARSVAVVQTPWLAVRGAVMHDVLIKPSGFTADEQAAVAQTSETLGFQVGYLQGRKLPPSTTEQGWIGRILSEPDDAALARAERQWPLDVSPVDDDRPYFFYQNRLRDSWHALWSSGDTHLFGNGLVVLLKVLMAALVMVVLCIAGPLWWMSRRGSGDVAHPMHRSDVLYVSCLGLGYMFIELGCIQRLLPYLGTPTHALTAVLLVLLLAGGIGSRAAANAGPALIQRLLYALVAYAALLTATWQSVAAATAALPIGARAVVAGIGLAPLGLLMGIPLPSGLAALRARDAATLPWLWGINGAASVLGSVLATLGSMHAGISALLIAGVALYVGAALLWPQLSRQP
jgi:hypothetical protein